MKRKLTIAGPLPLILVALVCSVSISRLVPIALGQNKYSTCYDSKKNQVLTTAAPSTICSNRVATVCGQYSTVNCVASPAGDPCPYYKATNAQDPGTCSGFTTTNCTYCDSTQAAYICCADGYYFNDADCTLPCGWIWWQRVATGGNDYCVQ